MVLIKVADVITLKPSTSQSNIDEGVPALPNALSEIISDITDKWFGFDVRYLSPPQMAGF